jgi:hypothetical protein
MATLRLVGKPIDNEDIPDLCMKCGTLAEQRKDKTFNWYPPWVYVLILVNLVAFAIVAVVLTKKRRVPVPLCTAHRNHWLWRQLVLVGGFVGLAGLIVLFVILASDNAKPRRGDDYTGLICVGSVAALIVWLLAAVVLQATAIRPTEITDYSITLTNVSEEFARAYKENRNVAGRIDELARERWEGGRHRPPPRARDGDRVRRPGEEDEPRRRDTFQEGQEGG